ncbi:hypothetical protein [Bradyrhizobium vignae]|uniref:Uncharacterized protein n=1 Tax=Bradyrhizobium vignae TaxID=1549949 RepID=A0ABS3ZWB8_9BRAD|nr:hypothetical protein [Bradyrhizobium vignae]MBP0111719.1 hypothetical protein [Bradyrhizobium vignae]
MTSEISPHLFIPEAELAFHPERTSDVDLHPLRGLLRFGPYPRTKGVGIVHHVTRKDAPVAFRIVYPSSVARFAIPAASDQVIELLSFAGKIWWPYGEPNFRDLGNFLVVRQHLVTPDEWRDDIYATRDLLKVVPEGDKIVNTESFSRFDLPNKCDEVTAQVQRILAENFMVCDDVVYAAGGVPVHAVWRHPRFSQVGVVSSGIDRRVTGLEPLNPYPGFFARAETQEAFSERRFWQPGVPAPIKLPRSQQVFAQIEVVGPTPIPDTLSNQVQIDALFRIMMRSLDWFIFHKTLPDSPPRFSEQREEKRLFRARVRQAFRDAVLASPDDFVTDTKRMEALRTLFVGARKVSRKHSRLVEALEKSFRALNRRNPREELAPEDLATLDSLVDSNESVPPPSSGGLP